jgi:hypothetical protein
MAGLPKDFKDMNNYQKGYAEGLDYSKKGPIGKKLDDVLESAMPLYGRRGDVKKGFEQGLSDMDKAKATEKAKKEDSYKKGGCVKMASGGKVSQLAKANGIAVRGKTRGKIC